MHKLIHNDTQHRAACCRKRNDYTALPTKENTYTHTQVQSSYCSHHEFTCQIWITTAGCCVLLQRPLIHQVWFFLIPLPTWNKPNHHCTGKTEIQESSIPCISFEILWKSIVYWGLASYFIPTAGSNLSPFSKPRDRKRRVHGLGSDYTQVRSHWAWPHHWRGSVIPTSCETCCKTRQDESCRGDRCKSRSRSLKSWRKGLDHSSGFLGSLDMAWRVLAC